MRFDIYGRFELEVIREDGRWIIHRLEHRRRRKVSDFVIPSELRADEIATYLDDMFHEWAGHGDIIRRID